ncbi:MAG TPA: hypothetical protein V6C76_12985 [Drouetiella sp.]
MTDSVGRELGLIQYPNGFNPPGFDLVSAWTTCYKQQSTFLGVLMLSISDSSDQVRQRIVDVAV